MKKFNDLKDLVNEIQVGKIELENLKQNLFKSYFKNLFMGNFSAMVDERTYVRTAILNVQKKLEEMEEYIKKITTFNAYSLSFFIANVMSSEELVNIMVLPINMNEKTILKDEFFSGQETHYLVGDDEVVWRLKDLFFQSQGVEPKDIEKALQGKKYVLLENKDNWVVYDYLNSGEVTLDFDDALAYLNLAILCLINWRIRHPFYEASPGDDLIGGLQDYNLQRQNCKEFMRQREKNDGLGNL